MGKKYIVELENDQIIDGHIACPMQIGYRDRPSFIFDTGIDIMPYTEPDLEQMKEAFEKGYGVALDDLWKAMQKAIKMYCKIDNEVFLRVFHDVKCDWGESVLQALFKNTPQHLIDSIRQYEQKQEMDGLRQNIQTIVDQCGYTLDEIAEVLKEMRKDGNRIQETMSDDY